MGLRLGFHYHIPAEQREDGIYMPGYLGRFVDSLAVRCEQIACFLHSPQLKQRELLDYRLASNNVKLIDIGPHCAAWKRTLMAKGFVRPIAAFRDQLDVMLIRGPSPLLPAFSTVAEHNKIPTTLLLVGSNVDGIDDLHQPMWRKELIRIHNQVNQWRQDRIARRSLTFVNSHKLFSDLNGQIPNLIETRTTTLSKVDFFERIDTCQALPVHLLFSGRFSRSKGLIEIVQALALLVEKGQDIVLDLVGWPEAGDNIMKELMFIADRLGVSRRIINHGGKTVGPELFGYYQRADIYVTASKSNFEGFPRTIWEAMANSLPVVATKVGSIPDLITGAAELIEPGSVEAVAEGIERLLIDPLHRQDLIAKGLNLARSNTLEQRSLEMIEAIQLWLKEIQK